MKKRKMIERKVPGIGTIISENKEPETERKCYTCDSNVWDCCDPDGICINKKARKHCHPGKRELWTPKRKEDPDNWTPMDFRDCSNCGHVKINKWHDETCCKTCRRNPNRIFNENK